MYLKSFTRQYAFLMQVEQACETMSSLSFILVRPAKHTKTERNKFLSSQENIYSMTSNLK